MNNRLQTYREVDTLGRSQVDLILQVYDGAIASFITAKKSYENKDQNGGYEELERAKRFLIHLYTTLDLEQGGQVADNLGRLYAYMINQTNVVEASKDIQGIDSNLTILRNLRQGWSDLKAQSASMAAERPAIDETPRLPMDAQVNTSA